MRFAVQRVVWRGDSWPEGFVVTGQLGSSCRRGRFDYCADCGSDLRVHRRIVTQATLWDKLRLDLVRASSYALDPFTDSTEYADYVMGLKAELACFSPQEQRWMHDSYSQGCDDAQHAVCGFESPLEFVGIGADGALLFSLDANPALPILNHLFFNAVVARTAGRDHER